MEKNIKNWILVLCLLFVPALSFGETILLQEKFDDASLASRGWYDGAGGTISTTEHIQGSLGSFECRFLPGATGCNAGAPRRHLFTSSNSVYVSFWIKHSSNWVGSGKPYHPHIFYILSNKEEGDWDGLANNFLALYIDETLGYPVLEMQDGKNIDVNNIGVNLVGITENRAVAGCNGTPPDIGQHLADCYYDTQNGGQRNGTTWFGPTAYFLNANQKNQWHHIEAYYKLNTISNGIGQPNGIVRYWYDGHLEIDHSNVILRTGKNPDMLLKQLVIAPWISDGSPVDQTFWIDELVVADQPPGVSSTFTITTTAGQGGSISPFGKITVNSGESKTFSLKPDPGYHIASVSGCNGSRYFYTYTTGTITADCTVNAVFEANNGSGVYLPWMTTFDCADWIQDGNIPVCDGISVNNSGYYCDPDSLGGGLLSSKGYNSKIELAGNNTEGLGGKGFRISMGDGKNNMGATPHITFNTPQPEFWARLYKREPLHFSMDLGFNHAYKVFYIGQTNHGGSGIVYIMRGGQIGSGGGMTMYKQSGSGIGYYHPDHSSSVDDHQGGIYNWGWSDIWGGETGDGKWHSFELHVKKNSAPGVIDGVLQIWVDGVLRNDHHNINWDYDDFTEFWESNSDGPANGGCTFVDLDDYAVTNVAPLGRDAQGNPVIGPISGQQQHTVTGIPVGNGTITPATQNVAHGSTATLTVTPNAGNHIASVTGCDPGQLSGNNTYTTGAIMADCTVTATFEPDTPSTMFWSTTYNCADWNTYNDPLACDGLSKAGGWTCNEGGKFYEQITAYANNPAGAGGKGQRRWKGSNAGVESGGTIINFALQSEVWIRWYMRYQAGFKWTALYNDILAYLDNNTYLMFTDWDKLAIHANGTNYVSTTGGWDTIMKNAALDPGTGHRVSDGQFHYYELHIKNNGSSGVIEVWVDGVRYVSSTNVNVGTNFSYLKIEGGGNSPNNSGCYYVDYDDIAISNTGYIGPVPTLLWSTTYNCTDWNKYTDPLNCDGLAPFGGWTCDQGGTFSEQITAAANNSAGLGGKGERHWKGNSGGVESGGTIINFASQSELWIRWYMRYQAGFKWTALYSDIIAYLDNNTMIMFYDWNKIGVQANGMNYLSTTGGWDTVMKNGTIDPGTGHRTSDGQFHYYEMHIKNNGSSGVIELWVDGVQYVSVTNVNIGTNFSYLKIEGGASSPNNGGCYYVDYDDIAISKTGYIGPIPGSR